MKLTYEQENNSLECVFSRGFGVYKDAYRYKNYALC